MVEAVAQAVGHGPLGEQRGPAPADVLEDRGRPHDVQVRVLLAGEGGRRQVLRRRARADGVGGLLAEPGERAGDRRRQIVGDGDPFEGPADLRAERADRLAVVRVQARQPIEPIVDRRRFPDDPPEGVRRHAEARRHADAFDARELPQVRALAADDRDLRLVDLFKTHHVAVGAHRYASRGAWCSKKTRATSSPRVPTPTFSKIALRWSCTVHGEMCRRSAIAFVGSPCATSSRHRSLPVGEAVGVRDQRRELVRPGGFDDHGGLRVRRRRASSRARAASARTPCGPARGRRRRSRRARLRCCAPGSRRRPRPAAAGSPGVPRAARRASARRRRRPA